MRGHLAALVGTGFMLAACGTTSTTGTSGNTSGGTTGGSTTGGTSGGTTTGTTTGASTGGGFVAGALCSQNSQCQSGICDIYGNGHCCSAACSTSDQTCGATACDDTGACVFPSAGGTCGTDSCTGDVITKHACDGSGSCVVTAPSPCPNHLACQDNVSCATSCGSGGGTCASGFYCDAANTCQSKIGTGACTSNAACASGICGLTGSGNCCASACNTADMTCGATGCDATTSQCVYPMGQVCGSVSCVGGSLFTGACDDTGTCVQTPTPCPNHLACDDAGTSCLTSCAVLADCTSGFYCNGTSCAAQKTTGTCTSNDICTSGICGISGVGHFCCTSACTTGDPVCGATDCDNQGACVYPSATTACGPGQSCTGSTQTGAMNCDGKGTCPAAIVTGCTPYICGPNACLTSCADNSSCASGNFCEIWSSVAPDGGLITTGTCCGLTNGGTIAVDGVTGADTACCGLDANGPCQSITRAMTLIDTAKAQNVTISVAVDGGGGDWSSDSYPIELGWGAVLSAPGVFFLDPTATIANHATAIIENGCFWPGDTVCSASIVGTAANPVGVGMDSANATQTADVSAIAVRSGATLYLANASVNGSLSNTSSAEAILVSAGATLWLGEDQSGAVTGTVQIGNALGNAATDGFQGIVCEAGNAIAGGCTIQDATLVGQSSVIIQGQEGLDIDAEDYGSITLTSDPVMGPTPKGGFGSCPNKNEGSQTGSAVLANGLAMLTFKNGTVQCIGGAGFQLQSTAAGSPTVTIDGTLIQNTDLGIYASDGTAAVTNSTISFNFIGVQQASNGTTDLNGGGNTVICSSSQEYSGITVNPGVDVYNTSSNNLAADNVAWDTTGPDYFQCDTTFASCSCNIAVCSTAAGGDDMDAVEDSTNLGGITTTGNTQSATACN